MSSLFFLNIIGLLTSKTFLPTGNVIFTCQQQILLAVGTWKVLIFNALCVHSMKTDYGCVGESSSSPVFISSS